MSEPTGTPFGKYVLLDRIAAGGMAEIFRARYAPAPGVTKQVVIKKILPHYAENKSFIGMFTNEARIVMGLSHGNIAQVFDFGSIDGDYFLAMELVEGPPLSKVIRRIKAVGIPVVPPEVAIYVTSEMLKGLHYAHTRLDEQGRPMSIVHRDVSPQNVLISWEGQVKLVDFGIARARNAAPEDTNSAAVKGKYAYFAPEQAKAKELDARTDVFASGIVLYELLTGELPFQGKMMEALTRIVKGQFHRPRERNARISEELEHIVLRALATEKADRYQTAQAFHEDLQRYLFTNHPTFTQARLGHLLEFLFEDELVKTGRPVQLPADFMRRVEEWKEPVPETALTPLPPPEELERMAIADREEAPTDNTSLKKPAQPASWGKTIGLGLASIALGIAAVFVGLRLTRGTLEVTSTPVGAIVSIDGKPMATHTPLKLDNLEGARTYTVEVTAPGYLPWNNAVPLKRGQHLIVNAELALIPPPKPEPVVEPVKVEPPPPPPVPPVPDRVHWPLETFELDLEHHRLDLVAAGARRIELDPTQVFRVSLARGPMLGWAYSVVNPAGAAPGLFTTAPLMMKSATQLFVFHVPQSVLKGTPGGDETRPRTLTVKGEKAKKPTLEAIAPTLNFPESARVTVDGLDPKATYEVTAKLGTPTPSAAITHVLVGTPAGLTVVPMGVPQRFSKTSQLWLTVLDESGAPLQGHLAFDLHVVPKR